MKNILAYIFLGVILISCNKREDYFHTLNLAPKMNFSNGLNAISDSIKIGGEPFTTSFILEDEEKLTVKATQSKGTDKLSLDGNKITIYGVTEGINDIKISVEDSYKVEGSVSIRLTVFKNAKPLTKITAEQSVGVSKYEVYINAKNSVDIDNRFGGKIVLYEYKIGNNYMVQTELSEIRYIFNSPGQKQIAVRTLDNDGEWSAEVVKYINIQ